MLANPSRKNLSAQTRKLIVNPSFNGYLKGAIFWSNSPNTPHVSQQQPQLRHVRTTKKGVPAGTTKFCNACIIAAGVAVLTCLHESV